MRDQPVVAAILEIAFVADALETRDAALVEPHHAAVRFIHHGIDQPVVVVVDAVIADLLGGAGAVLEMRVRWTRHHLAGGRCFLVLGCAAPLQRGGLRRRAVRVRQAPLPVRLGGAQTLDASFPDVACDEVGHPLLCATLAARRAGVGLQAAHEVVPRTACGVGWGVGAVARDDDALHVGGDPLSQLVDRAVAVVVEPIALLVRRLDLLLTDLDRKSVV